MLMVMKADERCSGQNDLVDSPTWSRSMPGTLLFLSHDASRTGAPIFLLNFLRWLRRNRNVNFRVLTGRPGALTADFAATGTVDSIEPSDALWYKAMRRLQLQHRYDSGHLSRLRGTLLGEDISLIYVNSVASASMIDLFSSVNCPVICHVHELDWAIRALGVENLTRLEKRRPLYIAVSQVVKKGLVESYGIPADRIVVIHGFVPGPQNDEIDPENAGETIRRRLGISREAELVCACGSIESRKGTDLFLQVASKVVQEYRTTPVHFVWVGGTPDKVAAMRSQVANSALKDVVHFVGRTSDTEIYFKASKVFLLTSREDPFPLVVMEAAQSGNPTVCFADSGGAPEFVERDAGFVVPDFDVSVMADRVIELLSSPVLRDRMGQTAKQKVTSLYNIEVGAAKIAAVIQDAIRIYDDERRNEDVTLAR